MALLLGGLEQIQGSKGTGAILIVFQVGALLGALVWLACTGLLWVEGWIFILQGWRTRSWPLSFLLVFVLLFFNVLSAYCIHVFRQRRQKMEGELATPSPDFTTMKILMSAILLSLLLAATAVCAYIKGRNDVWISEFKIYDSNLIKIQHFETNQPAELREFMKGRYYYLANRIPESWLGNPYDYRQVSTNVVHLSIGKEDAGAQHEYERFKKKSVGFRDPQTGKVP